MVATKGYMVLPYDPSVAAWAEAAYAVANSIDTTTRRHGGTWFVGVDVLPNDPDGSVGGVAMPFADMCHHWHAAQLSIVYAGYPKQDVDESDAAHRFRLQRDAAHMDGLLPEGPDKRRHLREPHGFILGMPLNAVQASPLVVWEGSHVIMRAAFAAAFNGIAPQDYGDVDTTDVYQAARRKVFETCSRVEVRLQNGGAVLLHRHLIHGVAPWQGPEVGEGRMVAYFRPMIDPKDWL